MAKLEAAFDAAIAAANGMHGVSVKVEPLGGVQLTLTLASQLSVAVGCG